MDYLKFYGLDEDPFRITSDPGFFYGSESHNNVLHSMGQTINRRDGFQLITGKPGTGKTTTLKVFIEKCSDEVQIALIINPRLCAQEFLLAVLNELDVPQPAGDKNEIIKAFHGFLGSSAADGKTTVIIVDEAQLLPDETLEELRLISNLEREKGKPVQIILIGQPELKERLRQNQLTRLSQRITVSAVLHPLTQLESSEYISFRLSKAGKGITVFDEQAKQSIYSMTEGLPRTINLLASRAIMSAFIEESRIVGERHVRQAASYVFYSPPRILWTLFNRILGVLGCTVDNKPVIVDKNLATPRPIRPVSRSGPAALAVIAFGAIAAGGIYFFVSGSKTAAISGIRSPLPTATASLSLPLRNLPGFIPRSSLDRAYGKKNPGWELYRGKVTEFRVKRERNGTIKGIQVLDQGGAGVPETFMQRALHQVAGTTAFKAESTELKEGYKIERGTPGTKLQMVCYRDGNGGRLRAFVLTWL